MRIVDEIPHELFKITVFSWNAKYIIKFELDNFEQVFKLNETDASPVKIREMINEKFLNEVFQGFLNMRNALSAAYQAVQ
jgi:hypothetical protein